MTRCASSLPCEITAGLDFQAVLTLANYPAPAWSVRLVLRGPGVIDLDATPSGADHVLMASAATTGAWTPGTYTFSLRATSAGKVVEVEKGQLTVLPDLAAINAPTDLRSQNEIALEAIDAVLAKKATHDQMRYVISGASGGSREIWRVPVDQLLKLRAYYANLVRAERAKARGRSTFGRPVTVKFSDR